MNSFTVRNRKKALLDQISTCFDSSHVHVTLDYIHWLIKVAKTMKSMEKINTVSNVVKQLCNAVPELFCYCFMIGQLCQ